MKRSSTGEIFIARDGPMVIGMLKMFRPGKAFSEFPGKYITTRLIKAKKNKIGYIAFVAVEPLYQGHGVGKRLIAQAISTQKIFGADCIVAHAWQGSPGGVSERLFSSYNFESIKMHKSPWKKHSERRGPDGYWCQVCGNPCICDGLEMVRYLE